MSFPVYPSGQAAAGTLLQVGSGASPESFTTVGRVGNLKITTKKRTVDTTSHSTVPAGGGPVFSTHIPTIIDTTITFDLFIKTDNSSDRLLLNYFINGTLKDWQILQPDSVQSATSFAAFLNQFDVDSPVPGATKAACILQVSGPVTWFE